MKLQYGFWFINWCHLVLNEGNSIPGEVTASSQLWLEVCSKQNAREPYAAVLNRFPFVIGYTIVCWLHLLASPMKDWVANYLYPKVKWTGS